MDKIVLQTMTEIIGHYDALHFFQRKKVYLGPANDYTAAATEELEKRGVKICGIVDEHSEFRGMTLSGIEIGQAEDHLVPFQEDKILFLTDQSDDFLNRKCDFLEYWLGVKRFCFLQDPRRRRLKEFRDCLLRPVFRLRNRFRVSWLNNARNIWRGKRIYNRYFGGQTGNIYLFPYASLGDIYILGLYRDSRAQVFRDDYILVVIKGVCVKVAEMVGFTNVIGIEPLEMDLLCRLNTFLGPDYPRLSVLHYSYTHTNINAVAYHSGNTTMGTCYNKLVFHEKAHKLLADFMKTEDAQRMCVDAGIQKGNCVILSPYAKSVELISPVFWEELAKRLMRAGYQVFTNCAGAAEKPVHGTKRLDCKIEMACSAIDYAGFFIGLRSGFCDVIATTNAKKVILYPKVNWYRATVREHCTFDDFPYAVSYAECECPCAPKMEDIDIVAAETLKFFNKGEKLWGK